MERKPIVAGKFYQGSKEALIVEIEECFNSKIGTGKLPQVNNEGKRNILGLVSPHAGYVYSGPVAGHGFGALADDGIPETAVIIGPNHQGVGKTLALSTADEWETPLGKVKIDKELGNEILGKCTWLKADEGAHKFEHSVEVQIPFLQYLYGDRVKIVPICMLDQTMDLCEPLGKAIAGASAGKNVVIIASTDFTHYESADMAKRKDKVVLDYLLKIDPSGVIGIVDEFEVSMCGPGPVATMLVAAKEMGAKEAVLLKYANSGDTSGDYERVVGYASVVVRK